MTQNKYTRDFNDVLATEKEYIDQRRQEASLNKEEIASFVKKVVALRGESKGKNKEASHFKWDSENDTIGLSISGGGIRSATFHLGLLQGLAKLNIFKYFDYFSTVSGGGYIGSSLTSLLSHPQKEVSSDTQTGVDKKNFPYRFNKIKKGEAPGDERKEVKWLRQHSMYLAPSLRPFSLDLWRLIGSYLVNLILANVPTLATLLILVFGIHKLTDYLGPNATFAGILFLLGSVFILSTMVMLRFFGSIFEPPYWFRRFSGYFHGVGTLLSVSVFAFGLFVLLAVYLPQLESSTDSLLRKIMHGVSLASLMGIAVGLFSNSSEKLNSKIKFVFNGALLLLIPIGLAQFIRVLWMNPEVFEHTLIGVPTLLVFSFFLFMISKLTNTNRISLHSFYRDRLSEAYLIERVSDGKGDDKIVNKMDTKLKDLHQGKNGAPYHLIGCTINVPSSKDRYLRGRGSDFFMMTQRYIGSQITGFQPTSEYDKGRTTLATAMAVSGASVSPLQGRLTSSKMAFVFTLLNLRLARWMPNPNPDHKAWFRFWPYYYFKELLKKGKETNWLLNISDGGHYENLGLYQLLKRRTKVIFASDSGADPDFNYEDLSILLRRIRIDLGINIQIDLSDLRREGEFFTKSYFVTGTINYPDGVEGILVFIKSTLTGREPEDLLAYKRKNPSFPDQPTSDQFYDEAQFESYRELGYLAGRSLEKLTD